MSVVSRGWDEIIKWYDVYNGKLIVVRIDSSLSEDAETMKRLGKQMAFLRRATNLKVIVVQGSRNKTLSAPEDSLEKADHALRKLNKRIVEELKKGCGERVTPVSLAGYDKNAIEVSLSGKETEVVEPADLKINKEVFSSIIDARNKLFIPVVYPFCAMANSDDGSKPLRVDADVVALAIARDMKAHRLIICSNVFGILDRGGKLIPEIFTEEISEACRQSKIRGDMVSQLFFAGAAVSEMGKGAVVIVDVRYPDCLLNELLSDQGDGTLVRRRPQRPAERDFPLVPAAELRSRLTR